MKIKKGFTIIEILIAASIFTLAAIIASRILVDIVQIEKRTAIENAIYEDARIAMEQIVNAIQSSAIDYDEYFSQMVIQGGISDNPLERVYGINHGVYGSRMSNPMAGGDNPANLGVECSDASDPCLIINTNTTDTNTGQNPWNGDSLGTLENANAFCDDPSSSDCEDMGQMQVVDELYLINNTGNDKIIMARKPIGELGEGALAVLTMQGRDMDQNGFIDIFSCHSEFSCGISGNELLEHISYPFFAEKEAEFGGGENWDNYISGISLPSSEDLSEDNPFNIEFIGNSEFVPITPLRTNIKTLNFVISPIEDPYRAYNEENVLRHPTVTIVMEIDLTSEVKDQYPGEFQTLILQTTVAAGVIGPVNSYPPVDDLYYINEESWINGVLPPSMGLN
jgi:prepilin-type N-terminal cleavage/methylation domain-containing protein